MHFVSLKNLSFTGSGFCLSPINLDIKKGEFFAILGSSGSGKTFLLESIAGLRDIAGEIHIDGKNMTKSAPEKRNIGFIYQDFALFPNMSARENILFSCKYKKDTATTAELDKIYAFLQIEKILDRKIANLSGGEKQRIGIARALASKPKLFLLDEPLSSIDPSLRNSIMQFLLEMHKEFSLTTVYVTHNFREASFLADRIGVLLNGSLLQVGDCNSVLKHPSNLQVAEFLGHKNIFECTMLKKECTKRHFSIDPNLVEISRDKNGKEHTFGASIINIIEIVDHFKVYLSFAAGELFVKVPLKEYYALLPKVGESVYIGFNEKDVWFL